MPGFIATSAAILIPATLFLIALIYSLLGLYGWRHRDAAVSRVFTWMMLSMGLWSLLYGFEISSKSLPWIILWAKTEYLGIVTIPVFWLAFSLAYTGRENLLKRRGVRPGD